MTPDIKELVKRLRASAEHQARGGGWADPCKVTDTLNWNAADAHSRCGGWGMRVIKMWLATFFVCPWVGHDWTGTGKEQGKHCRRCGAWEYDR